MNAFFINPPEYCRRPSACSSPECNCASLNLPPPGIDYGSLFDCLACKNETPIGELINNDWLCVPCRMARDEHLKEAGR